MNNLKYYNDLQSKTISFLRFFLIIGVVFIHSRADIFLFESRHLDSKQIPLFCFTKSLFSNILPEVSVPLFFLISGFLFFYNINFTKVNYLNKINSRIKTIFIPYISCISIILLYYIIAQIFLQNSFLVFDKSLDHLVLNYSFVDYLHAYGIGSRHPIVFQFWFIRDLIILIIITPIIYFIIKRIKYFFIIFIGILWYFQFWQDYNYIKLSSLFFFCFGGYYSIEKKNLVIEFRKLFNVSIFLYPTFVILSIFIIYKPLNLYIINFSILFGIIFFFSIVSIMIEKNYIKLNLFLLSSSFFLFAFHIQPLSFFTKFFFIFFKCYNDIILTLFYFISIIITIFVSIISYYYLNKFLPKFTNFITGGRNLKK